MFLDESNKKIPNMLNFEIPQAINFPKYVTSKDLTIANKAATSKKLIDDEIPLNLKESYQKITEEEKFLHTKLSKFNWNKMKPSEVENFKQLIRIRIKMIINRELKPESLCENLPSKLCAKINKVIFILVLK